MTHTTEQERADFEEFASVNGERPELVARNQAGEYLRLDTATGWMWWQAARRAPVVPQCPFPCGWKNLHKLVVAEGAFLAKSLNECEPITTHQCDVVMRVVHYGIEMARSMLAAAPQPPETAQLDDTNVADMAQAVDSKEAAREVCATCDGDGFIYDGKGIKFCPEGCPDPNEAAPVQLPEPIYTMRVRGRLHEYTPALQAFELDDGEHNLYTEQQVRDLLTAAKVERKPLTADEIKEPKNGDSWRVEWWNESCRMMLPADKALDSFRAYKNGTMQFTLKQRAHGIGNT